MEKNNNKNVSVKKGFSLVEVLFSVLVLSVGISSVAVLMTSNIKNSITAKNQVIASMLAQEGIELVRNMKDNNPTFTIDIASGDDYRIDYATASDYAGFNSSAGKSKQLFLSAFGFYWHSGGTATKFYRKISIAIAPDPSDGKNIVTVTSYVSWNGTDIPNVCNVANKCTAVVSLLPDQN